MKEALPDWAWAAPEWAATLRLFNSPRLHNRGCLRLVDVERRRIDFPRLAEDAGASGPPPGGSCPRPSLG